MVYDITKNNPEINLQRLDKISEYWAKMEFASHTKDFQAMTRAYWGMYYTLNPEKRKKLNKEIDD